MKVERYIRFETLVPDPRTGMPAGLFFYLYDLTESPNVSAVEVQRIVELRKWFNENLSKPDRFSSSSSKGASSRVTKGLSWFKPNASEYLSNARQLLAILKEHGYHMVQRETTKPGKIVYEDEHQVVAEPFADT